MRKAKTQRSQLSDSSMISAVLEVEIAAHCDEEQRTPYLDPYRLDILCIRVNGDSYALLRLYP